MKVTSACRSSSKSAPSSTNPVRFVPAKKADDWTGANWKAIASRGPRAHELPQESKRRDTPLNRVKPNSRHFLYTLEPYAGRRNRPMQRSGWQKQGRPAEGNPSAKGSLQLQPAATHVGAQVNAHMTPYVELLGPRGHLRLHFPSAMKQQRWYPERHSCGELPDFARSGHNSGHAHLFTDHPKPSPLHPAVPARFRSKQLTTVTTVVLKRRCTGVQG